MCFLKENVVTKKKIKKWKNEKEENMNIGSQKPTKSVFQQYNRIDRRASILKESSAYSAQHWIDAAESEIFLCQTRLLLYPQCNSLLTVQEDV